MKSSFISLTKRRIYEKGSEQQKQREQREELRHEIEKAERRYAGLQVKRGARKSGRLTGGADMRSGEDSLGSYTGVVTDDCHDKPIQDADDL